MTRRTLLLQTLALLPLALCTGGMLADAELTPRYTLGLLAYGAVALAFAAARLTPGKPWRPLPAIAAGLAVVAQLVEEQMGLVILGTVALVLAFTTRFRLFGAGAAVLLTIAALKLNSYGFN